MKKTGQNTGILLWVARIMSIVFALFLSIFALDIFSEGYGFWKTILGLFMHLIPTFIIILIILVSWRRALLGGIVYTILGILYMVFSWRKFGWEAYVMISGPLFILGIIFFIIWYQKKQQNT